VGISALAQSGHSRRTERCCHARPTKQTSVKCFLRGLSPFVHWSFVAPNIFGVRMIMVPPHARFAVVPIVVCSGFAGGLNGTPSFQGGGVVGTKHISPPLERDNAWLHVTAHLAAVESTEPVAAIRRKIGGDQAFPKVSSPISGLSAVLGQNALGKPGDCKAARLA
jgi:hypothetical protein